MTSAVLAIENFLLLASTLALAGVAVARAMRWLTERGAWEPHPQTLGRLYAAAVLGPPAIAAWIVTGAWMPEYWLTGETFRAAHDHADHALHLLGALTGSSEPVLARALVILGLTTVLVAAACGLRRYRLGRVLIHRLAGEPRDGDRPRQLVRLGVAPGLRVALIDTPAVFSFVWGARRPAIVLSRGVLRLLTRVELRGLLAHEAAHVARRDNAINVALAVGCHLTLAAPLTRRVLRWRAEQVEIVCDEIAAARTGAPLSIAEALVKVGRAMQRQQASWLRPALGSGFATFEVAALERRIHRLVGLDPALEAAELGALARGDRDPLLVLAAAAAIALLAAILTSPLAVHAGAESIIRLLF